MVVYADVLFLVNFVSSYIMLQLLGKLILKSKTKIWRLCAASMAGGIAAVLIFSREIPPLISYLIRLITAVIMVFTSFYEKKRQLLSQILWLAALSGMMVAAMFFLTSLLRHTTGAVIKSGTVYFDLPQKIFLPLLILSYAAVNTALHLLDKRRAKRLYIVTVTHRGKKVTVTALFDSGNLLREPVTGKCVSLMEWDAVKKLFDVDYEYSDIESHTEEMKLWAVPYHTVENKSGIMLAFLADSIAIAEGNRVIEKTFIGLCGRSLSGNNEYNAILNSALL